MIKNANFAVHKVLSPRERAVRREAAEGFFVLCAGLINSARHSAQDGKKPDGLWGEASR